MYALKQRSAYFFSKGLDKVCVPNSALLYKVKATDRYISEWVCGCVPLNIYLPKQASGQ